MLPHSNLHLRSLRHFFHLSTVNTHHFLACAAGLKRETRNITVTQQEKGGTTMQKKLALIAVCLLPAFATPTWGGSAATAGKAAPKSGTAVAAPKAPVQAGNYKRDPSKPMAMRQYLKELKEKQKAAAKNAASKAGQTAPQPTEGGTQ
jgi:hypothetical protein